MSCEELKALIGNELVRFNDSPDSDDLIKVTIEEVTAQHIGLYFSAHWCPPCRAFTPQLAKFYNECKQNENLKDKLEIIFVSSDRDEEGFMDYFKTMPWLALPFDDRDVKGELATKFNVRGIPKLVILKRDNLEIVAEDGRQQVMSCKKVENFDWPF